MMSGEYASSRATRRERRPADVDALDAVARAPERPGDGVDGLGRVELGLLDRVRQT